MLRYMRTSPLWNYLVQNIDNIPFSTLNNSILVNKNIIKGFAALKLYSDKYDLNYMTTDIDTTHLSDYDMKRIRATFEMVPANLTGLERYQVSLVPLYIQSIQMKTEKYYEYLGYLTKNNKIDIIDLYILINPQSTEKCFEFFYDNLISLNLPIVFLFHVEKMLLQLQKKLNYRLIKKIVTKMKLNTQVTNKLDAILRLKSVFENIDQQDLQKISNQEIIDSILDEIERMQKNVLGAYFVDGENIELLRRHIVSINTMVNFEQNISLEIKVRILNLTRTYLPLLPRRNVFVEKVSSEEKQLKMDILKYEENVKKEIEKNVRMELRDNERVKSRRKSLTLNKKNEDNNILLNPETIETLRNIEIIKKSNIVRLYNWSQQQVKQLINHMLSNPIYYLSHSETLLKLAIEAIQSKYKVQEIQTFIAKYIKNLSITNFHSTLKYLYNLKQKLIRNNIQIMQIDELIDQICKNKEYIETPETITLKQYLECPDAYNNCENIDIVLGGVIQLIGYLSNPKDQDKNNKINIQSDPILYQLLSEQDYENIMSLIKIIEHTKRKVEQSKLDSQDIEYRINGVSVRLINTPLFSPIFTILKERQAATNKQKEIEQQNIKGEEQSKEFDEQDFDYRDKDDYQMEEPMFGDEGSEEV